MVDTGREVRGGHGEGRCVWWTRGRSLPMCVSPLFLLLLLFPLTSGPPRPECFVLRCTCFFLSTLPCPAAFLAFGGGEAQDWAAGWMKRACSAVCV